MSTAPIPGKLVDGVFRRVLAPDLSAELKLQLAQLGIDLSHPGHHEYPRATWYQAVDATAAALYPQLAGPEQLHRFGRHVIDALQARGIVKGAWLTMAKMLGPKRSLKQAAEHSDRYSPVKLEIHEKPGRAVEIHVHEDRQLEFLSGLLEGLLHALGGKAAKVHVQSRDGQRAVLAASWS